MDLRGAKAIPDLEIIEFDTNESLEAFNTDGLRTLLKTMSHVPNMKEKTLRYPGHVEYVRVLKESGFLDQDTINVNGNVQIIAAITGSICTAK